MTLPPDPNQLPLDNSDDPLGGMDPLAWLESLARRQGVDTSQLTTDANLDIAMPDANAIVDGPGYTPGYDVRTPTEAPKAESPAPVQAAPAAEIDPMSDPIAWMESLARRQGVDTSQLTTAADMTIAEPDANAVVDGPGYTPGYDVYSSTADSTPATTAVPAQPAPQFEAPRSETPKPESAQAVPAAEAEIDPMSDPIAWMESLARRQGVDTSQLTTAADMTIAEPDANAVVDGPGYTPGYDVYTSSATPTTPVQPPVPPVQPAPQTAPVQAAPAAPVPVSTPEPARPTPFVPARPTPFVPANPPSAPVSAPAASITPTAPPVQPTPTPVAPSPVVAQPVAAQPPAAQIPAAQTTPAQPAAARTEVDLPDITDPLAWLESLTTPHPTSNFDYSTSADSLTTDSDNAMTAEEALAWLDQLTHDSPDSASNPAQAADQRWLDVTPNPVAEPTTASTDETGGLSDDMTELQRWLNDQAKSLEELHDLPEAALPAADAPAVPVPTSQLPDWLLEQAPVDDQADQSAESLIPTPGGGNLPDWLSEAMGQPDVDTLPMNITDPNELSPVSGTPADNVIGTMADLPVASTLQPATEEEYDPWIEALADEENRQRAGDDTLPEWYLEAVSQSGLPLPDLNTTPANTLPALAPTDSPVQADQFINDDFGANLITSDPTRASGGDLPDWLASLNPDADPLASIATPPASSPVDNDLPAFQGDIPDWLREAAPTAAETDPLTDLAATPTDELPDWLRGLGEPEQPPALAAPSYQSPAEPQPQPIVPSPVPPPMPPAAPQPVVQQTAPTPVQPPQSAPQAAPQPAMSSEGFDPTYHLEQAQYHADQQNYNDSLGHYQTLIDKSAALDQVVQGVSAVVAAKPDDPRARRLLGDAHMRQGNLQAALDSYRSALDRL